MKIPVSSSIWQHPFVDLFRQAPAMLIEPQIEGDVKQVMDKVIRKMVYRIRGNVAASNCLQYPSNESAPTNGIGLTGRFIYIQLKPLGSRSVTINLDIVTKEKSSVRITLSTIYSNPKASGTVVRIPLRLCGKWSVIALDMHQLLRAYAPDYADEHHAFLKTAKLCSNMLIKGLYTSDCAYSPEAMPKTLRFFVPEAKDAVDISTSTWDSLYEWQWFPEQPRDSEVYHASAIDQTINFSDTEAQIGDTDHEHPSILSQSLCLDNMFKSTSSVDKSDLGPSEISLRDATVSEDILVPSSSVSHGTKSAKPSRLYNRAEAQEVMLHQQRQEVVLQAEELMRKAGIDENVMKSQIPTFDKALSPNISLPPGMEGLDNTWPDPILNLARLMGFTGKYPNCLLWTSDGTQCVFPSVSTLVALSFPPASTSLNQETHDPTDLTDDEKLLQAKGESVDTPPEQRFLFGHTTPVCAMAFNSRSTILASGQEGKNPMVRLWDFASGKCCDVLTCHASGVTNLCFAPNDRNLCTVGLDEHHRSQIIIWDIANISIRSNTHPRVIARQTCEFPISIIRFSPYEANRLVSCGRENIRFWRIRRGHLPGCPVILNEYARNSQFTDLAFDKLYGTHPSTVPHQRPVYVSSDAGTVMLVDHDSMELQFVYKLHDGPINCLSVNEGFCVTGANDHYLRVWPLDFSDYFLEAYHEAPVSTIDVSQDGLKILVGTENGAVGILDVSTQHYQTLMRSHTEGISVVAIDPSHPELATASGDGTIRIWSTDTGMQTYEFDISQDDCTCISYHPSRRVLAVGFESGCTRIFDILTASVVEEYQQHRSEVVGMQYASDGTNLFSAGRDGQICQYEVHRGYQPSKMYSCELAWEEPVDSQVITLSRNCKYLAFIGKSRQTATILSASSLKPIRDVEYKRRFLGNQGFEVSYCHIRQLLFSPNSKYLLAFLDNCKLVWFSVETGEIVSSASLLGHGQITCISISPNGQYLVSGGTENLVHVWDYHVNTLEKQQHPRVQTFVGHSTEICFVGFTGDGKKLISTGQGNAIFVWSFEGDHSRTDAEFSDSSVSSIYDEDTLGKVSDLTLDLEGQGNDADGEELPFEDYPTPFSPSDDISVHSPRVSDDDEAHLSVAIRKGFNSHCLLWNPDQASLLYAVEKNLIAEDLQTAALTNFPACHGARVCHIQMSNNRAFAVSLDDACQKIGIWDLQASSLWDVIDLKAEPTPLISIEALAFTLDNHHLVIGSTLASEETQVAVFNLSTKEWVCREKIPQATKVRTLCSISTSLDIVVHFSQGKTLQKWTWNKSSYEPQALEIEADGVVGDAIQTFSYRKSEDSLVVCDINGEIWIIAIQGRQVVCHWNINGKHALRKLRDIEHIRWIGSGHGQYIVGSCASLLFYMHLPAAANASQSVDWKAFSSRPLNCQTLHVKANIQTVSWKPSRVEGIITTATNSIWYVNLHENSCKLFGTSHASRIEAAAVSPDGKLVGTIDQDTNAAAKSRLRIWESDTLEEVCEFQLPCPCTQIVLNAYDEFLNCVAICQDGSLHMLNLQQMRLITSCIPFPVPTEAQEMPELSQVCFLGSNNALVVANSEPKLSVLYHLDKFATMSSRRIHSSAVSHHEVSSKMISCAPHEPSAILALASSSFYTDTCLAVARMYQSNYKILICHANDKDDRVGTIIEAWSVRGSSTMPSITATFCPRDPVIVIYSNFTRDKVACIEFRNYQNRQVQRRISLYQLPKSIQTTQVNTKHYLICEQPSGQVGIYDLQTKLAILVASDRNTWTPGQRLLFSTRNHQVLGYANSQLLRMRMQMQKKE